MLYTLLITMCFNISGDELCQNYIKDNVSAKECLRIIRKFERKTDRGALGICIPTLHSEPVNQPAEEFEQFNK